MKKRGITVVLVALIAAIAITLLCGCSSYSKIRRAYEAEGYSESENVEEYQTKIVEALGEDFEDVCSVHLMADGLKVALILEFKSTQEMEDAINESESLKGLISDIQKSDYVSGNCVLLFYTPLTDAADIFKSTK